ncbi:MAG: UPF0175 family protein [Candidatus Micrarchaeota archaeon]
MKNRIELNEEKLNNALIFYREGKISIGKIGENAGINIWKVFEILKERNLDFETDEEDFYHQLNKILRI